MITARHYETAADVLAGAHAVRMRLMKPRNAVKDVLLLASSASVKVDPNRPLWQRVSLQFDSHVKDYVLHLALQAGPRRKYITKRCEELGITYQSFVGRSRDRKTAQARNLIWYELRLKFQLPYPEIARLAGGRDHSTVISGVRFAQKLLKARGHDRKSIVMIQQSPGLTDEIRADYGRCKSLRKIAAKYKISYSTLQKIGAMEGWVVPLSKQYDMAGIREAYEAGWMLADICHKFGIKERTFGTLRKKMGWPMRPRGRR